jgi:hypothetical protein
MNENFYLWDQIGQHRKQDLLAEAAQRRLIKQLRQPGQPQRPPLVSLILNLLPGW